MKTAKRLLALVLVLAMALSLSACGGFAGSMVRAVRKLEKLDSLRMDTDVQINMSLSMLGMSTPVDMSASGTSDINTDPLKVKSDLNLDLGLLGITREILSYCERQGDGYILYLSPDGESWSRQTLEPSESSAGKGKISLSAVLALANRFEKTGTVTVRGSEATAYEGVIKAEEINLAMEQSGGMDSLREALGGDEDFSFTGSVPVTVALDNKSGMIVMVSLDLTEIMQDLMPLTMDRVMASVAEEAGMGGMDLSALGLELNVDSATVTETLYDFDAVGPIEIPEAALNAPELSSAA